MLKMFWIELNIGLRSSGIVSQISLRLTGSRSKRIAVNRKYPLCDHLNGTACFLNLLHGAFAELVGADMNGMLQLAPAENLYFAAEIAYQAAFLHGGWIYLGIRFKSGQPVQIDGLVFLAENIIETPFRQTAMQRHLPPLESGSDAGTGSGELPVGASSRCFTVSGTHASSHTLFGTIGSLGRF